jgi:hypothetical protein
MATYYVWSGAGGTNAGTSWTNAYTAFASAVTAATTTDDVILVQYTHQEEISADATYTFSAHVSVISVNKDSSDVATAMDTGGWIGNSTTNRSITINGADRKVFFFGITLRVSGSATDNLTIGGAGHSAIFDHCYLWMVNTNSGAIIALNNSDAGHCVYKDCTFVFSNASQNFVTIGPVEIVDGVISGTSINTLFDNSPSQNGTRVTCRGLDTSFCTGTLVGDLQGPTEFVFDRCKLGSGVTILAAQTANPTRAGASVHLRDCSSGDTHGIFGYYDALGAVISETGIYYTSGAAGQSWKIVTSSNASQQSPFTTPWINTYNTTLSSMTPRLEILRDGSTAAYDNDEVWAETLVKDATSSTFANLWDDAMAPHGTPAAQDGGAGLGSWTGESGTAWSGKIDSGSAVTPAENGALSMRVLVGLASATVYVDPQIRTA